MSSQKFSPLGIGIALGLGVLILLIGFGINALPEADKSAVAATESASTSVQAAPPAAAAQAQADWGEIKGDYVASEGLDLVDGTDQRVEYVGNGDHLNFYVKMSPTDIGGVVEAGTIPRNIIQFSQKGIKFPAYPFYSFHYKDKDGQYLGKITFPFKALRNFQGQQSYMKIMETASELDLTPAGKDAVLRFCRSHTEEAGPFCVKALGPTWAE